METEDGVLAVEICSWCSREGSPPCRVLASVRSCAFCRRRGKRDCSASLEARPLSVDERLESLEGKV